MKQAILCSIILIFALPGLAAAQPGAHEFATVGLYLSDADVSRPCRNAAPSCGDEDIQITGELYLPYYAYLCVFNGDRDAGVSGVSFAIDYAPAPNDGVDVFEWFRCSDLEFSGPGFPAPGVGNVVVWPSETNCQEDEPVSGEGVSAVGGYFYMIAYGNDELEVIPRGVDNKVTVVACDGAETLIEQDQFGTVGFSDDGSVEGNLPCVKITIEDQTWGGIKQTLGGDR